MTTKTKNSKQVALSGSQNSSGNKQKKMEFCLFQLLPTMLSLIQQKRKKRLRIRKVRHRQKVLSLVKSNFLVNLKRFRSRMRRMKKMKMLFKKLSWKVIISGGLRWETIFITILVRNIWRLKRLSMISMCFRELVNRSQICLLLMRKNF